MSDILVYSDLTTNFDFWPFCGVESDPRPNFTVTNNWVVVNQWGLTPNPLTNQTLLAGLENLGFYKKFLGFNYEDRT